LNLAGLFTNDTKIPLPIKWEVKTPSLNKKVEPGTFFRVKNNIVFGVA